MKNISRFSILLFSLFFFSCETIKQSAILKDDGKLQVVFVQINDVYEISPVSGGKEGGMARVATLKKQYQSFNPNTYLVLAGDFVSPSVYNSLVYQKKKIRGAQMVDAMNAAGVDLAIFGNHEFDLTEKELQERINESNFNWVCSNTFHKNGQEIEPFRRTNVDRSIPFPETYIMQVGDKDGTNAKIGFIGLTLSSNPAEYVSYKDPLTTATTLYNQIKDSVDVVVAITHQSVAEDIKLAKQLPNLAAILGGHEHGMIFEKVGNVYITKAHANARSAYVVKLNIDKTNKMISVVPELKKLDYSVELDSATNIVVQKWNKIAVDNYSSLGFDANKIVINKGEILDGRETESRTSSTGLTRMISSAISYTCPNAELTIFNSGSIRLDDVLTPPVTEFDILRTLPFGGGIVEVEMKGSMLVKVIQAGIENKGSGGFLQYKPEIKTSGSTYLIDNRPINLNTYYRVALTSFLFSGKENRLDFLTEKNPDIRKIYEAESSKNNPTSDIRLAVIRYLESTNKLK